MSTTTISIRTDAHVKQQAQDFFQSMGLTLTTWINLLLADVATNQRLAVDIQPLVLQEVSYDDLSDTHKQAYNLTKQTSDEEFIRIDLTDERDFLNHFEETQDLSE